MTKCCKPDKPALLKLADYLETVPRKKFNMNSWAHHCGTASCVAGYACVVFPWRLKLRYHMKWGTIGPIHRRKKSLGYYAFADAFKLCFVCSTRLCSPVKAKHITPKQAAKAIRKVVNND